MLLSGNYDETIQFHFLKSPHLPLIPVSIAIIPHLDLLVQGGTCSSCSDCALNVQTVLQCLLENSLLVKAEKCKLHATSVSFLGYIIGQDLMEIDPAKVSAITSWPILDSWK